jgi:threonylcarbamoyladenosine tRNA methylthiotransferase MtaB
MKKVAFYTLGCKLNYSETSTISRQFEERGFKKVSFESQADVYIINTCSVTENADKKCKKVVKEALKHSPNAYIAIIGCYAQLKPQEIIQIPGVDAVLGAAEKFRLLDLIDTFEKSSEKKVLASEISAANTFNNSYSYGDRTRTFLKVQDGCDYNCSFCTIPLARGSSRSDSIANIVKAAQEIAKTDVKEIVLTGVNIGDFGLQNGKRVERFIDLIRALDEVNGIERFRISSIEPNLLTDEIISFVAQSKRFVPHFHIPLQSGSNKILKLMRRRYQRELYADRVNYIKSKMPNCCIGVDVITGFPGETEDDFLETYQFLNELDVSYLHVFTYSERDNTHAINLGGKVQQKGRDARTTQLRNLSEKKKRFFYEQQIGTEHTVLFEADVENGMMFGFTENYLKVTAKYDPLLVNELKDVKIIGINSNGLAEVEELDLLTEKH